MSRNDRFLRACRLRTVDCTPVWLMRQAGRYMDEYRAIRSRHRLHDMFRSPELAAEVTLQPVRAFEVDAAIIFSDILLPLQGMGIDLEYTEERGPVIHNPIRSRRQVESLRAPVPEQDLGYALESIRLVRSELNARVPLIGFAGAPFTLASYMIEGGTSRNFIHAKMMMYGEPEAWRSLMTRLSEAIGSYLLAQIEAGAQAVQLFDSWVGCLSPADYRSFVLPYSKRIFELLAPCGVPCIHFGTRSGDLLSLMREAGGHVIGVDWRTPLIDAWKRSGLDAGIQGNLDPIAMMAPREVLEAHARDILYQAGGRAGHIFNLGHGILPATPVDAVRRLIDIVHNYRPSHPSHSA